jgi:tRNA modification GTPase
MREPTIYALASGRGRAGIAVIRVSGPAVRDAAAALTSADLPVRRAVRVSFTDPDSGELLDRGLAIFFPGPASFTGEDVLEMHVHGGLAVVDGVLAALSRLDGLRLADPGEFTRRGFENGKIDLTAAEGVADLVAAETAGQRRQALAQMGGALAEFTEGARARLVAALAHWEAAIDFSDEELPADLEGRVVAEAEALATEISGHLADGHRGERLRQGVDVAIVGAPNAGKSSLLNRLARRDAAIVSENAGTTRDIIEVHFELAGYPVILADTAGLRDAAGEIEAEGVRRALERARRADLRIVVLDGVGTADGSGAGAETLDWIADGSLVAVNKTDAMDRAAPDRIEGVPAIGISAKTGDGIDKLLAALEGEVARIFAGQAAPLVTRARHREALAETRAALERFLGAENRLAAPELAAEDLRLAARSLGRITGSVDVEDLLDVIFADFCIGK